MIGKNTFLLIFLLPLHTLAQSPDVFTAMTEPDSGTSRGYSTLGIGAMNDFSDNYQLIKKIIAQYQDAFKRGEAVHIDYAKNTTTTQVQPRAVKQGLLIYHRNNKYYLESYRDHVKNGLSQAYFGNGQLYYQIKYTDGKPTGIYKQYKEDGSLHVVQEIVDLENGFLYFEYYHENGQLASQGNVYKGLKINEWYYYDPEGNLEKIKYFDSRGNIVQLKEVPKGVTQE